MIFIVFFNINSKNKNKPHPRHKKTSKKHTRPPSSFPQIFFHLESIQMNVVQLLKIPACESRERNDSLNVDQQNSSFLFFSPSLLPIHPNSAHRHIYFIIIIKARNLRSNNILILTHSTIFFSLTHWASWQNNKIITTAETTTKAASAITKTTTTSKKINPHPPHSAQVPQIAFYPSLASWFGKIAFLEPQPPSTPWEWSKLPNNSKPTRYHAHIDLGHSAVVKSRAGTEGVGENIRPKRASWRQSTSRMMSVLLFLFPWD